MNPQHDAGPTCPEIYPVLRNNPSDVILQSHLSESVVLPLVLLLWYEILFLGVDGMTMILIS